MPAIHDTMEDAIARAAPHQAPYCGRFAPSPTGPLHFGSLVAALASWLEARTCGGTWRVRMEDVDRPRCVAGAADGILRTLERLALAWDGPVLVQSGRDEAYAAALAGLREQDRIYPCLCTRREIAVAGHPGVDGAPVYSGKCRRGVRVPAGRTPAWRLRVPDEAAPQARIAFVDAVQGLVQQNLARDVGDFVLCRADGLFAYQLAVVVDDAAQGITHVVRGADLLDSTPRQIGLQQALGYPTPAYAHIPVVVNAAGEKLSKQTLAPPLDLLAPAEALHAALRFLGQAPPDDLARADAAAVLTWARAHWALGHVPRARGLPGRASPPDDPETLWVPA